MLPLLRRGGQALAALVCTAAWNWLIGYAPWAALTTTRRTWVAWLSAVRGGLTQATHLAMGALLVLEAVVPRVAGALLRRYPDVFPVLTVLLVTPVLVLVYAWAMKKQVTIAFAQGLIPLSRKKHVL